MDIIYSLSLVFTCLHVSLTLEQCCKNDTQENIHHEGQNRNLEPARRDTRSPGRHDISLRSVNNAKVNKSLTPNKGCTAAAAQHTIEIAYIVDYMEYSKWVTFAGADKAEDQLKSYVAYTAQAINAIFKGIQHADIAIRTSATYVKIITSADEELPFIKNFLNLTHFELKQKELGEIRSWLDNQRDVPKSDHYLFITGHEIKDHLGFGVLDSLCTPGSISISENKMKYSLPLIAIHELGHSLSATHNGLGNSCNLRDRFIMSDKVYNWYPFYVAGKPWRFSPCAISSFVSYLKRMGCTLPSCTKFKNVVPQNCTLKNLNILEQCREALRDKSAYPCVRLQKRQESICRGLFCKPSFYTNQCTSVIPREFTYCGTNKWCVLGKCVQKPAKISGLPVSSPIVLSPTGSPKMSSNHTALATEQEPH